MFDLGRFEDNSNINDSDFAHLVDKRNEVIINFMDSNKGVFSASTLDNLSDYLEDCIVRLFSGGLSMRQKWAAYQKVLDKLQQLVMENLALRTSSKQKVPMLHAYGFEPKLDGVKVTATAYLSETNKILTPVAYSEQQEAFHFGDSVATRMRLKIHKDLKNRDWIDKGLALLKLDVTINDIVLKYQHMDAEARWFSEHAENLVDSIKKEVDSIPANYPNKDFWFDALNQPRVEFSVSTSPCELCQLLFRAFHFYLKSKDLHLPIVIYGDSICNTGEECRQIFYITEDGAYHNTRFVWDKKLPPYKALKGLNDNDHNFYKLYVSGFYVEKLLLVKPRLALFVMKLLTETVVENPFYYSWASFFINRMLSLSTVSSVPHRRLYFTYAHAKSSVEITQRIFNKSFFEQCRDFLKSIDNNLILFKIFFDELLKVSPSLLYWQKKDDGGKSELGILYLFEQGGDYVDECGREFMLVEDGADLADIDVRQGNCSAHEQSDYAEGIDREFILTEVEVDPVYFSQHQGDGSNGEASGCLDDNISGCFDQKQCVCSSEGLSVTDQSEKPIGDLTLIEPGALFFPLDVSMWRRNFQGLFEGQSNNITENTQGLSYESIQENARETPQVNTFENVQSFNVLYSEKVTDEPDDPKIRHLPS